MAARRTKIGGKTILHFDTSIYSAEAVSAAVKEFGRQARLLESDKKAPLRVEVDAPDPAADELANLALQKTIEEKRG